MSDKDISVEKNLEDTNELNIEIHESVTLEKHEESIYGPKNLRHHSHNSHTHSHTHSHSHSHHHNHHHSKRRKKSSNNKTKESFVAFIHNNKNYLLHTAIAILTVACLIFVGLYLDKRSSINNGESTDSQNVSANKTADELQLSVSFFSEDVVIAGPAVEAYMNADAGESAVDIYDKYEGTAARLDVGSPVKLSCEVIGIPDGYNVKNAELLVADNIDLQNPYVDNKDGYDIEFDIYNLKTGTEYYYQVNLTLSNGTETSVGGSFRTASGPRVLTVDGVYNIRDIGGWTTEDGKAIKQGLLYRGCELDGAVEPKYTITQDGVNTMLTVLGIKTDMDLRSPTDNKYGTDALGVSVEHIYYSAPMYSGIFDNTENSESIRRVFSDLSDESKYPVYLHCTYGQDRTGTVCYLLEALLGLDEESMKKDYQLSALHHGHVSSDDMSEFIGRLKALPGNTMSEKVEGYLLSIGITEGEIESIRSIFLDD